MTRLRKGVRISSPSYNRRPGETGDSPAGSRIPSWAGGVRQVLMVAGEASADVHGAHLVRAIRNLCPNTRFWGIGGERMRRAGVRILIPSADMAVVGLTEVISRLNTIRKAAKQIKHILKHTHPDLLILIDYPEFNIHMAGIARRCKVPVLYYISPQVWAWRRGRVRKMARRTDRMAVILPFEQSFYRKRGVVVDYVGHPLMDTLPEEESHLQTRPPVFVTGDPVIGLLPGSRREEIRHMLPVMLKAVEIVSAAYPGMTCILPLADTIDPEFIRPLIADFPVKIHVVRGRVHESLQKCRAALVTSGTATLDAAVMGIPMVIVYRVSRVSYWMGRMLIKVPYIGLVNLIAGEQVVPEVIQDEVTPRRLADETTRLLVDGDARRRVKKKLEAVRQALGDGGASQKTAQIAMELMNG